MASSLQPRARAQPHLCILGSKIRRAFHRWQTILFCQKKNSRRKRALPCHGSRPCHNSRHCKRGHRCPCGRSSHKWWYDSFAYYTHSLTISAQTDVKMNALYDPRVLYDYGGPVFDHNNAKLVQRHITDTSGTLIPPWLEYEKLRTGTVVLIRVSLKVYPIQTGSRIRMVSFPTSHLPFHGI